MWKDRVWASEVEILAAAKFQQTDIYLQRIWIAARPFIFFAIYTLKYRVNHNIGPYGSSFLQAAAATMDNQTTAPSTLTTPLEITTTASQSFTSI